jgi:hypothetical protein
MGGKCQWSFQLHTTGLLARFGSKLLVPGGHFAGFVADYQSTLKRSA